MALPKLNDTPKYEIQIPSTGENIRFRPYLVKEEKVLMLAMESKDPKQVINAIADTIIACVDTPIKKSSLKTYDVEFLFLKIRSKSVGETTTFGLKCTECETPNDVTVNIDAINIENTKSDNTIKLNDDISLRMEYPNYEVLGTLDFEKTSETEQTFYIITKCIHSILTEEEALLASDHSTQELTDFIESLDSKQFAMVKEYLESMPKLQHEVSFDCVSCGHNNSHVLEGIQDFF